MPNGLREAGTPRKAEKYNVESDNYVLFNNESSWECSGNRVGFHATWKRCAYFTVYGYYAYSYNDDETSGQWVGLAPLATGYCVEHCDGRVDVTIDECWAKDCPPSQRY
jgi:hypothetical protein